MYFILIYLLLVIICFRFAHSLIQSSASVESQRTQRTAVLATYSVPNRRTPACITLLEIWRRTDKPAIGLFEKNGNLFS